MREDTSAKEGAHYRRTCRFPAPVQLTLYNVAPIVGVSRTSQQHTDWLQDSWSWAELTFPLQWKGPAGRNSDGALAETGHLPVNFSYSFRTSSVGPSIRSSPRSSHNTRLQVSRIDLLL